MRPVVREGYQKEKSLVSECAGHDFQKPSIILKQRQENSCVVCLCSLGGEGIIRKQVVCRAGWSACDAAALQV